MTALPFRVMVITDEGADAVARVARALSRPTPVTVAVQLRMKGRPVRELRPFARELRALTRERGATLIVNERIDVALEVEADGVHLPRAGLSVACARALLPPQALIGVSCHNQAEVDAAVTESVSYALLSPVHAVQGKAPALGFDGFRQVSSQSVLPLLALGGIGPADVATLKAAGAAGIAVLRGVMGDADPAAALGRFCAAWAMP